MIPNYESFDALNLLHARQRIAIELSKWGAGFIWGEKFLNYGGDNSFNKKRTVTLTTYPFQWRVIEYENILFAGRKLATLIF